MTGTLDTEPGNCATFLLKLEGVLDGLVQDMFTSKVPEAKVSIVTPGTIFKPGEFIPEPYARVPRDRVKYGRTLAVAKFTPASSAPPDLRAHFAQCYAILDRIFLYRTLAAALRLLLSIS